MQHTNCKNDYNFENPHHNYKYNYSCKILAIQLITLQLAGQVMNYLMNYIIFFNHRSLSHVRFVMYAIITLRASSVGGWMGEGVCGWVYYHDNSKLRSSILTKLGLYVKVVTISS